MKALVDIYDSTPGALYTVRKVIPPSSAEECWDVPGASEAVPVDGGQACIGDVRVDPDTAINGTQDGDCVVLTNTGGERLDCANPRAGYRVVKRVENPGSVSGACEGVPGTPRSYEWEWRPNGRLRLAGHTVVLCLGDPSA